MTPAGRAAAMKRLDELDQLIEEAQDNVWDAELTRDETEYNYAVGLFRGLRRLRTALLEQFPENRQDL